MNNNRGGNHNQRKFEAAPMYTNSNQFPHSGVQATNTGAYLIGGPQQRTPRNYVNQTQHNVSEMKHTHISNMAHNQIQMVPAPHIPQRQSTVYLPATAYQGSNTHPAAFYQFNPQQPSQAVIMPFIQNYPPNQPGVFYSTTPSRPIQMTNVPQGPQNPPVANMSNAQNSHGLVVQSQPMEMATNTQPLQVPQQPPNAPMQIPESRPPTRKKAPIKIIDPNTGNEIVVNNTNTTTPSQAPQPSEDELKKMKVQSQFQSQVQSVVKKNDTKASENNEGGEKVRIEFESKVKKLVGETTSTPGKAIDIDEGELPKEVELINKPEEISVGVISIEETPVEKIDSIQTVDVPDNTEVGDTIEIDKEILTNLIPNSTPTHEIQSQNIDNINISEDTKHIQKITDEETLKPAKNKKSKQKKKKNLVKDNEETINNVQPSIIEAIEQPVINTQENKENENDNHNSKNEVEEGISQKNEEISQKTQETQNNGIHEPVEIEAPKLPSYLDNLPYDEGQWSVKNPSGKKVYSKLFLLQLGSEAVCQKKPDVLKNWSNITKSANQAQFNSLGGMAPSLPRSQSASATGFMPAYFKAGNSQRGGMPLMQQQPGAKRNSSQGKTASKTAKSNTIHLSLSLREEVKLNQTENAWVPTAAKKATKVDITKDKNEEQLKTDEINKSVRSILNKITPENMGPLTERFKALPIDSIERLERTIDLVFEKAIEEQSFAPLYASLCSAMQTLQVSAGEGSGTTSFKKLIISKCQSLFELDKALETDSAKQLSEINSCKDPEKQKELQQVYEENERRLRKRSVGNCRFIGELFKQKILTPNIMLYCIVNLVTKHVEEPLECLCNLLKTVGKELEQSYNLNETFDKLKALTSKEMKSKIPSRIRFMIQDVIDLRRDKWIPRRIDTKPKLINEIENDAKNEAIEQSMALSSSSFNRNDNRDNRRGDEKFGRGGDNKSRRGNESEWNVVQSTKFKQQNYPIDQSKLQGFKDSSSVMTLTLGPSSKWSFSNSAGTGGGKNSSFPSSNPYAPLNDDKKLTSASQMMSSKSLPKKPVIYESEERQRMISGVISMMPTFAQTTSSLNSAPSQVPKETVELDTETADKIKLQCKNIIKEYEELRNMEDIIFSLTEEKSLIRTRHDEFVKSMFLVTIDLKPNNRTDTGKILAELLSKKTISMATVIKGIDAVLKDWSDYLVDYPQFFSYIAAIIAPLLISKTASFEFNNLKDACISICPANSSVFFIEVLQKILSSKETQNIKEGVGGILWIYNKWRTSECVPLDIFMPISVINKYFTKDRVGVFLLSVALCDKMKLTDSKQLYDEMHSWIINNISKDIINCPQFVRALTIAIVILCLKSNSNSFEDFFEHVHIKLLTCYIRSEPLPEPEIQAREVQCLYGIQIMSAALEHPGGMVLKLFHKLYQDSVISKESFEIWKEENEYKTGFDEDLETKTMAVVVLNSFFISLQTNDSDEEETADQ